MTDKQDQLTVQALGRPSYLGQLYDATTSTFISGFSFIHRQDVTSASIITPVPSTIVDFKEIKSMMDRARSLDLSASLSLSILGGAIDLRGIGSYLENKHECAESNTVAMLVRIRTVNSTLDVNRLRGMQAMNAEDLAATRATHVVTSITYGGNIIGTATQQSDASSSNDRLEGKFNLEVFKGIGKLFGVTGEARVDERERERLEKYNLHIRLDGDFQPPSDEVLPTTAGELLQIMKKSMSFIRGDGVPCDITLTPLQWFHPGVPTFRELQDADLRSLNELYDRILSLDNNRTWLTRSVEEHHAIFPSFVDACRQNSNVVADLVSRSRQALRLFLQRYRSGVDDSAMPVDFQQEMSGRFTEEIARYEGDREKWLLMVEWMRAGKNHDFPLVPVSEVRSCLNRAGTGSVALVLVPDSVQFSAMLQTYRVLAGDIRKWQSTRARVPPGANEPTSTSDPREIQYLSVYADPRVDEQLKKLDDSTSSVGRALNTARQSRTAAFLTYGLSSDGLAQLQWNVLNQDGWGVLVNQEEGWRYIGHVKKGLRHGSGIITYVDGSIYSGGWFQGKRDGFGKLYPSEEAADNGEPSTDGVFCDNLLVRDGVVVKATVSRHGAPTQFSHVTLRSGDSTTAHVNKIGRVFGWRLGQKFEVRLESSVGSFERISVLVNGSRIDPSEDPDVALSSWPLDAAGDKIVNSQAI
ncbi:hypothetical protein PHLGIDRAFT_25750 [Phlebiopsis gigantea 11061_1 CR5-6]|uniref:SNTX MACPF/CDC-like domain-containing protein n=1 Tax=Phlebiopsis gigantea (strain 11061_1 CR5-6) TaxID=745531 RepID=A0A0C3S318_PHLG1|nr:hypothetical protein PHLGIDRAFT_25750 [Phlebiopsis gigantea 11061_1 CR5-6]